MNARILISVVGLGLMSVSASVAEESPKKQATKEEIQARLAEHSRKKANEAAAKAASTQKANTDNAAAIAAPVTTPSDPKVATPPTPPPEDAAKILPKVDVRKGRITELDRQLEKQNQEIAREKKNTKPTPLDDALNGSKVSTALAFLGGQSSTDRSTIAKERVSMMEEERDMIEAIAQATTKEEKQELQKTLDSMRAMRRELEQSLH